jgi:signal-transduction protein with cAMP-binding, CBS, and nucleotidyltransferase domain
MGRNRVITFGRMRRLMDSRMNEIAARFEGVRARDLMRPLTLALDSQVPVRDVIQRLLEFQVDVAAVIDEHGKLVGRIAEGDLVAQLFAMTKDDLVAADVAQKTVGCFAVDTPMPRICEFFSRAGVSRVFVVAENRPVGMITAGKVLEWLSELHLSAPKPEREPSVELLEDLQPFAESPPAASLR